MIEIFKIVLIYYFKYLLEFKIYYEFVKMNYLNLNVFYSNVGMRWSKDTRTHLKKILGLIIYSSGFEVEIGYLNETWVWVQGR